MRLRQPRHLLLCARGGAVLIPHPQTRTSQTAAAHLRDTLPDEQRPAAEAGAVSYHGPPHGSAAHRPKTG